MSASAIYLNQHDSHDFSKFNILFHTRHSHVSQPIYVPTFHLKFQLMVF